MFVGISNNFSINPIARELLLEYHFLTLYQWLCFAPVQFNWLVLINMGFALELVTRRNVKRPLPWFPTTTDFFKHARNRNEVRTMEAFY